MSPLPFHLVFFYLASYSVAEARTVRDIVGQNVSLSFTFININGDIIHIKHKASDFVVVWPYTHNLIYIEQPHRVHVVIGNITASNTTTVTISITNLTENDSGIYSAMRRLNLTEILDRVLLETIDETFKPDIGIVQNHSLDSTLVLKCNVSRTSTGKFLWSLNGSMIANRNIYFQKDAFLYISNLSVDDKYNVYTCKESGRELESDPYSIQTWIDHFIIKTTTLIEDTTASKHYTTQTVRKKEDTDGIHKYITTAIDTNVDAEETNEFSKRVPTERYLLFIIVGMGAVFAAAFLACRRHKKRICFRAVSDSNVHSDTDNDNDNDGAHDVNQAGKYWTIVSNAKGEMSTAIETGAELQRDTLLVVHNEIHKNSDLEDSMRSDDIYVSQEIVGYLNPISSRTMEYNDYIHPIHSNSLSTDFSRDISDSLVCNMKMKGDVKSISI